MSNKERIEAMEKEMVHSVRARVALEKRVSVLKGIVFSREQPDDVFNEGLEAPKPKPIDWSQVADCVPVKVWDDSEEEIPVVLYPQGTQGLNTLSCWDHRSLITGIDITWHGGDCPLPNGVVVEATRRNMSVLQTNDPRSLSWQAPVYCSPFDIISFRVVSIHPDWTEEVGE